MLDLKFNRIQFTPDLMPSDITGTDIIQEDAATGRRQMVFAPGPIFANIVLADEINRTPPKTQSALLEAMQEHRVTIQGRTYKLEEPFFVFATQNPIELEGTYPLPEAQLDRFMFHIVIEHPPEDEEFEVVRTTTAILEPQFERPVSGADLVAFQRLVRRVPVADPVMRYALSLVRASRPKSPTCPESIKKWVAFGASVRAAQYLVLGGKARALTSGRYHVSFEDIRALAHPVLRHRVLTNFHAQSEGVTSDMLIDTAARGGAGAAVGDVDQDSDQTQDDRSAWNSPVPGARFVDPAVLARIGNLELVARTVVDGVINGLHRSPFFGASVDFAEHRGYVPGDDIRRVDWRVFARTDKYFVKEFEADSNANFSVLLDVSKSMAFGERLTQARLRQDAGGVPDLSGATSSATASAWSRSTTRSSTTCRRRPSTSTSCCTRSIGPRPSGPGDIGRAAAQAGRALRPPRHRRRDLGLLRRARGDLRRGRRRSASAATTSSCSTCSIRPEIDFPFTDASSFEDLESGEQMPVVPDALARAVPRAGPGAHRRR